MKRSYCQEAVFCLFFRVFFVYFNGSIKRRVVSWREDKIGMKNS